MNAQTSSQIPAFERRKSPRRRALLAGVLHDPNKASTWSCIVRNLSDDGARLEIASAFWVPNEFGIEIEARNIHRLASVVWKDTTSIGVKLSPVSDSVRIDTRDKLKALRQERESLKLRISQLTE